VELGATTAYHRRWFGLENRLGQMPRWVMVVQSHKPLSVLILGIPNPVSMGIARGLMLAGHRLAAIWYPERLRQSSALQQDRALSRQAPGLTLHGLETKAKVAVRAVPRFSAWPDGLLAMQRLSADVVISLLYPDRITQPLLDAFPGRVVNLHPSLLPAYRGPDPIFNMLWDETIDRYGGLTLHLVSPEFDRGGVLGRQAVAFTAGRSLSVYYMELVKAGTSLLASHLSALREGPLVGEPQVDVGVSPQGNRKPRDARLDSSMTRARVAWLCATIPQMTALRIEGLAPAVRVTGFVSSAARKTERPPAFADGLASFDVVDGHVTVRASHTGLD